MKPTNGPFFLSNQIFTAAFSLNIYVEFDQSLSCWISNIFCFIDFISSIFNKLKCYKNIYTSIFMKIVI